MDIPVRPITPVEASEGKHIPGEVFAAFNEMLMEGGGQGGEVFVAQEAVIQRILSRMPGVSRGQIYERGWLDVESAYRLAGWQVVYDKPGYNETYKAFWRFSS